MQPSLPFDSPRSDLPDPPDASDLRDPPDPRDPRDPRANVRSSQRAPERAIVPSPERPPVFVRHPRARRYVLRVARDGTVRITIPRWGSWREAAAFAARERAWIDKQHRRLAEERQRLDRGADGLRREPTGGELSALRERARRELPARLLELAAEHGLRIARVSVRNQRWRWGSCSRSAHICLNWRLVQMPAWVRDYVLLHELMHLKRMDHSPAFWKLVAAACPGYKKARAWLRSHGAR
jgi:predicted metal-dependent hydrolase